MPEFVDAPAPQAAAPVFVDAPAPGPVFVDEPKPNVPKGPTLPPPSVRLNSKYNDVFRRVATENNLDPKVMMAIHGIEEPTDQPDVKATDPATGKPGTGPDTAEGPMQMKPSTFSDYDKTASDIHDPIKNIEASGKHIRALEKTFNGDMSKVYAAYNQGAGAWNNADGKAYAAQAESNMAYLTKNLEPAPDKKSLSKGTIVQKPTPRLNHDMHTEMTFDQTLDQTSGAAAKLPGELAGAAYDKLPKQVKDAVETYKQSGLGKGTGVAAHFMGDLANLPIEAVNALMRDAATGTLSNMGALGKQVAQAFIGDPMQSGTILDGLAHKYGENSKDEIMFWSRMPGFRDAVSSSKPRTEQGRELQMLLGAHADLARHLATDPGERAVMTGIVEWYNPGNHIPGMLLKAPVVAGAKTAAKIIDKTPLAGVRDTVNRAGDAIYTVMPMGDRFHATAKKGGVQAAGEHHALAQDLALSRTQVQGLLRQENKLGNTTVPQRQAIHREQDKFFNEDETAHVFTGAGQGITHNPVTRVTQMHTGGLYSGDLAHFRQHSFVNYGGKNVVDMKPGTEAATIFPPMQAGIWARKMAQGKYSEALQLMPSITKQDADAFEASIKGDPMYMNKKGGKAWGNQQARLRLLGEHARNSGVDAVRMGDEIVFGDAQKALDRNEGMAGATSIHDRAFYTARAVHMMDGGVKALAPTVAKNFRQGYWARSGMFENELTPEEAFSQGVSVEGVRKSGGFLPGTQKAVFNSVREAEANGMQARPDFDPAVPLENAMNRSLNFQKYARFAISHGEPINFQEAMEARTGWSKPPALANPTGALGRKEFDEAVKAEAEENLKTKYGQQTWDAMQSPDNQERITRELDQEITKIYSETEQAWQLKHPGMVFRTDKAMGLPDAGGVAVPEWVKDAAIDSHPAFNKPEDASITKMMASDPVENSILNGVESVSHMMRTAFMADPTYHFRQNLAWINVLFNGHLHALDIARIMFAPHTIDSALFERAEKAGAISSSLGSGISGPKTRARSAYASSSEMDKPEPNLLKRQLTIPKRIKNTIQAYKNVTDGDTWPQAAQHIAARAMYQADKWNQDLTFKVFEDATAALSFQKLVRKGVPDAVAGREVRKLYGDTQNVTRMEQAAKLNRLEWFFSWFKTTLRLSAANAFEAHTVGANNAINQTIQQQNENEGANSPDYLTKMGEVEMKIGGKPYDMRLAPPISRKLGAINALASTPFTQGEGVMDFGHYVESSLAYSLDPVAMKPIFEGLPAMFGQDYQKQSLGDSVEQGVQALPGAFTPPQVTAAQHGAKDPVRYLEMLGIPVVSAQSQEEAGKYMRLARKFMKDRDIKLSRAEKGGSETDRAYIRDNYNPLIEQLVKQANDAYGR